jgi:3-phenylpropionate/cinnamic acid dioxygenase small subunit
MDTYTAQMADLLVQEAACIDERRWEDWLALMAPDGHVPTSDPDNEMSLVYYDSRQGLEDRVFRLKSRRSAASEPMARTCHYVTNVRAQVQDDGSCRVWANWQANNWRHGRTTTFWGSYEYLVAPTGPAGEWRIRRKKVLLMNDVVPTVLDVHLV